MVVKHGDRFLGVLGVMDTPRASARATIAALEGVGIRRSIMLSGDHQLVADSIARQVGLTDAWGRSEEHKSELQSLISTSYAVYLLNIIHNDNTSTSLNTQ